MSEHEITLDDFSTHEGGSEEGGVASPTELDGIPVDWSSVRLSEVALDTDGAFVDGPFGSNLKANEMTEEGYARIVQLQNIRVSEFINSNHKYISEDKFEELKRHGAKPGDLAIAKMAEPVARGCLLPEIENQYLVVADCIKLSVDESEYNSRYVMFTLNSRPVWKQAFARSRGSTRKRINLTQLKQVQIPSPPLPEQRQIATVLYTIDRAIEKSKEIIQNLDKLQKGTLRQLFENGTDRDTSTKETPMGKFPKHWELKQLQETCTLINGSAFPKDQQGKIKGKFPFIKVSDTNDYRRYVTGAKNYISQEQADEIGCNIHPKGTVILPKRGAAIMTNKRRILGQESAIDNNQIGIVGEEVQPLFLYYYLSDVDMGRFVQEGAVKSLTKSLLSKIRVPVPPSDTQTQIIEVLESIDSRIEIEQEIKTEYQRLKKGLQQDLLSGTVRTTDTKIEVPDEITQHG